MNKMQKALHELAEMDELAARSSPIHTIHPAAKLLTTIAYILVTLSFDKYDLSGLAPMVLWPILLFQLSGTDVRSCFYKLRIVLPLVMAVGLFNPLFDRTVLLRLGNMEISGGVISMLTLMLKGLFCLMASFLLMATTSIDSLCAALRRLHVQIGRATGSLHCDIWQGTAAELSDSNYVAVYPTSGWWKTRRNLNRQDSKVRYSLVVTLSTPSIEAKLYTEISNAISIRIGV